MRPDSMIINLRYHGTTKEVLVDPLDHVSCLSSQCEGRKIFFLEGEAEISSNATFSSLAVGKEDRVLSIVAFKDDDFNDQFAEIKAKIAASAKVSHNSAPNIKMCSKYRMSKPFLNLVHENQYPTNKRQANGLTNSEHISKKVISL